ncbi:MAG: saccharopine dehydrogenase family protein [Saccharofermentanales bacterium]|jgi:saccharopine dehydrogenase-like NADP-dependent oxidoreductase
MKKKETTKRVLLLGAGLVGSNAAKQLVRERPGLNLRIGDLRLENAERLACSLGEQIEAVQVDLHDQASLDAACADVDIILHLAGPYYRNARPVMEAAIRHKIDYLDVTDDDDLALEILDDKDLRARAEAAGVRLVMGCGHAPGLSNVMVRHMIDQLDTAKRAFVCIIMPIHIVPYFTPAVLDHMFAISSPEVMKYQDGNFIKTPGYTKLHDLSAMPPFDDALVFNVGHGETPMLGHAFPDLEEVNTYIGFTGENGNEKWATLADLGFGSGEILPGIDKSPVQVLAAMIADGRLDEFLETDTETFESVDIYEVEGVKDGRQVRLRTYGYLDAYGDDHDDGAASGARIGIELMLDGKITGTGLLTPEVCFEPKDFIARFAEDPNLTFVQETKVLGPFPNPLF